MLIPRKPIKHIVQCLDFPFYDESTGETELCSFTRWVSLSAERFTNVLGLNVPPETVDSIARKVVRSEGINDGVREEYVTIYNELEKDFIAAKELYESKKKDTERELEEQRLVQVERLDKQRDLLDKAKSVNYAQALEMFHSLFDLGHDRNQCIPKTDVTDDELVAALVLVIGQEAHSQWAMGDITIELINRDLEDVVVRVASMFKKSYSTISGYVRTCRSFPPGTRDPRVPFTVYREIGNAKLSHNKLENEAIKSKLVKECIEKGYNSVDARALIGTFLKKDTPLKSLYLVVNLNDPDDVLITKVFPRVKEGFFIFNLRSKKYFGLGYKYNEETGYQEEEHFWKDINRE